MSTEISERTAPVPLNANETGRARALLVEFQTNHPKYSYLELLETYPDDRYVVATKASKLFHVEVVLYQPVSTLHGVTEGNCVFLSGYENGESSYRPLWTAGHEVSHVLSLRKPLEHAQLVTDIMRDCVAADAFDRRSAVEKLAQGYLGLFEERPVPDGWADIVCEEVVADVAGNLWQDPHFWADIRGRDVNVFRHSIFTEIISRLEAERPRPYRFWASDAAKARRRFVEYMLLFLEPELEPAQPQ